ncbi:Rib/alpha-like domain-containing protein, partial [Staphylococcus aureus]|uniref:Rib/alpha-like domain-containing protein n=1 Tax=Staphylococcus aureus TaxID=1280 RepID=UPI003FA7939C
IPDYPSEKGTPTFTFVVPFSLPEGYTPGTVEVPVTVTYPDGTKDHVTVPVAPNSQEEGEAVKPQVDDGTEDYGGPAA